MRALSVDLRERIASALASDPLSTYAGIAARFAVSTASVERISRKKRLGQSLAPRVSSGHPPLVAPDQYASFETLAASRTDWTLQSLAAAWKEKSGHAVSITTTHRLLEKVGFAFGVRRIACERDDAKRAAFRDAIDALDPKDLVFLDEMGVSLALSLLYGWGKKGNVLIEAVTAKRGKSLSVLGALGKSGMIATATKLGAMKRPDFEHFLREDLLPKLPQGSTLVIDNATIHKGGNIKTLITDAGCRLLYLPPYSPDFNPIEMAWSFLKRLLRKAGPRDDDAREKAVADALAVMADSPNGFADAYFQHCNYPHPF